MWPLFLFTAFHHFCGSSSCSGRPSDRSAHTSAPAGWCFLSKINILKKKNIFNSNSYESPFSHRHANQVIKMSWLLLHPFPSPTWPFLALILTPLYLHLLHVISLPFSHSHSTPPLCPPPPTPNLYPLLLSPLTLSPCLSYVSLSGGEERLPRGTVVRSRCRLHWLNEEPAGRGECLCVCLRVSVFVSVPV